MTRTPIDDALLEKTKVANARQEREMEHWQAWTASGFKPVKLEPLLDSYNTLIKRKAVEFGGGLPMVPKEALEAEITKHVIGAFKTYDPNRGASLLTHVYRRMTKARRFVTQHQNVAYLPEAQAYSVGKIQRAENALTDDFGRPPTKQELADYVGMPVKKLVTIQRAAVKDIPASTLESDPFPRTGPRHQEVLSLLPQVLTPDEKQVFDLIYHPTSPVTSTTTLASRLGKNQSQVSRLKSSILSKIDRYS